MKKRSRELNPRKQTLITTLSQNTAPSLIKHLASCNDTVRFHSLRLLQSTLTTSPSLPSDLDMKKLWKGLFYTLWHCDKAPAQSELISRLSSFLTSLTPDLALNYFQFFVITLRREWSGIDHHRLDKFYLCIRRFVKAMFVFWRSLGWDLGVVGKFVEVLEVNCFLAEDKLLGNGVGYHVVSVFVEELKGCFVPVRKDIIDLVFRVFFRVMEKSLDKILVGKVRGLVFEDLLKSGYDLLNRKSDHDSYDDVAFGLIAMKMGFAGRFYEIASSEGCVQGNRKVVLKLHEEFLKLEKRFESSGVEIVVPDVVHENDDDDVPELIPIDFLGPNDVKLNGSSVVDGNGEADVVDDVEDARERKKVRKESGGSIKEKMKKKEKNNQTLDENSFLVAENLVEGSSTDESKSSVKKRKKKEKNTTLGEESSLVDGSLTDESKSTEKKRKKRKKKEKNSRPLDENSSFPENSVDAGSAKKSKKKEKKNEAVSDAPEDVVTENSVEAGSAKKSKKKEKKSEAVSHAPEEVVTENSVGAGSAKRSKKKEKKNEVVSEASLSASEDVVKVNESSGEQESNGNVLNEDVIANLQKEFENVAAELGSDNDDDDADFTLSEAFASLSNKQQPAKKKKKRAQSCGPPDLVDEGEGGVSSVKSVDGSSKKVRFSMKNNLVWKPHSPLPPQSLRIPPSVAPRGSALKKGVLPGPIKEVSPAKNKSKKKKAQKMPKRSGPWR